MLILNMQQWADDVKNGTLEKSRTNDGVVYGYNLTNYIYNKQPNTKMWHWVNKDVGIFSDLQFDYNYIEDYGNGTPDWAYNTIKAMLKVARGIK